MIWPGQICFSWERWCSFSERSSVLSFDPFPIFDRQMSPHLNLLIVYLFLRVEMTVSLLMFNFGVTLCRWSKLFNLLVLDDWHQFLHPLRLGSTCFTLPIGSFASLTWITSLRTRMGSGRSDEDRYVELLHRVSWDFSVWHGSTIHTLGPRSPLDLHGVSLYLSSYVSYGWVLMYRQSSYRSGLWYIVPCLFHFVSLSTEDLFGFHIYIHIFCGDK